MDCSETPWSAICTQLHADIMSTDAKQVGLRNFAKLSRQLETLRSQCAKIQHILQYCKSRYPKLMSHLAGKFEDEDEPIGQAVGGANPGLMEHYSHHRRPIREKRRATANLLNSLARLCVTQLIYPPIFFAELLKQMPSEGLTPKYGSGLFLDSPSAMVCANLGQLYSTSCQQPARFPCPRCKLVSYCSQQCRKAHWTLAHADVCSRALQDSSKREAELKSFYHRFRDINPETAHPSPQTVWDRAPAFGLLGKVTSEADRKLPSPLRLLFLDCFDLNNVIETVHQLDPQFTGETTLYINTTSMHCLARHIILWSLLLDIAEQTVDTSAVDAVVAIWYSAALSPGQYLLLMDTVLRLLNAITSPLRSSESRFQGIPVFSQDSDLKYIEEEMERLTAIFHTTQLDGIVRQITGSGSSINLGTKGLELWKYLTLMGIGCWDPKRQAWRTSALGQNDRLYGLDEYLLEPHLHALDAFRDSGLALPFGSLSYGNNQIPNPTLVSAIDSPRAGWAVKCTRYDPLSGWPINEVLKSTRGAPCFVPHNDLFGSQYFYVRTRILSAVERLRKCRIAVEFTSLEGSHLIDHLNKGPGLHSMYRIRADFHRRCGSVFIPEPLKAFLAKWTSYLASHVDHSRLVMLYQVARLDPNPGARPYGSSLDMAVDQEQVDFALSNFGGFISKFSDRFAEKLRKYGEAIRENRAIDMLTPLFMRHGPYIADLYSTIRRAYVSEPGETVPFALTAVSNLAAVPCKPSMVYPVDEEAGTSKQGKKRGWDQLASKSTGAKKNSVTTAEECYMEVFLTLLNHFEVFLEWERLDSADTVMLFT